MFTILLLISILGSPATPPINSKTPTVARISFLKPSGVRFFTMADSRGNLITGNSFYFDYGKNLRVGLGVVSCSRLTGGLKFGTTLGILSLEYSKEIFGGKIYLNFEKAFPLDMETNNPFWKN